MPTQGKLLDVPISEVQSEAEHYADMYAVIRQKQEQLKAQAEIVIKKMKASGQRLLTFKDDYQVTHRFEVVDTDERLKYTSKGEPEKEGA